MKKICTLITAFLLVTTLQAQKSGSIISKITMGVDIFNDFVQDSPSDINFRTINPGVNVYGMYNYPVPKSNISLAIGLGLGMHNLHSNGILSESSGISILTPYPDYLNQKNINYKKNKLQLTYLDIPAEIRYKSEGGFRLALGIKAGYLLGAHTKFKGDDPATGIGTKIKQSKIANLEQWRFGPTFQIGYKYINFTAFYSLTTVFDKTKAPDIYPISLGIALRPF